MHLACVLQQFNGTNPQQALYGQAFLDSVLVADQKIVDRLGVCRAIGSGQGVMWGILTNACARRAFLQQHQPPSAVLCFKQMPHQAYSGQLHLSLVP